MAPARTRKHTATAATARMTSGRPLVLPHHYLLPDQVVASPETGIRYRVCRFVGEGGFGQVYLADRVGRPSAGRSPRGTRSARKGRSSRGARSLCIKMSPHLDGWLREAYFGRLLDAHPRTIRVFDTFPVARRDGEMLYCLTLEYARHGDLSDYLARTARAGRSGGRGGRSRGSWRCSASCTAARRCTATSRR
jgi:serine/threonine protein kinase